MSFEKPNWRSVDDYLEGSKEVDKIEKSTKESLTNLNRDPKENPYGKGWNEIQEAERITRAERGVEESLAQLDLADLSGDTASKEFKDDQDIIRAEQFLMALSEQAEQRGFGGLRQSTFPGENI